MREDTVCFFIRGILVIFLAFVLGTLWVILCGWLSIGAGFSGYDGDVFYKIFRVIQCAFGFQAFFLILAVAIPEGHYLFREVGFEVGLLGEVALGAEVVFAGEVLVLLLPDVVLRVRGEGLGGREGGGVRGRGILLGGTVPAAAICRIFFSLNFIRMGQKRCSGLCQADGAGLFVLGVDWRLEGLTTMNDLIHQNYINKQQADRLVFIDINYYKLQRPVIPNSQFKISQSSNLSLYCRIFFFIEELSTQPTWSYSCRVTRKAGSVTISVPMRTWPCSMKVIASFIVSENLREQSKTASLRLQKAETDIFSATSMFSLELRMPMLYNFSNSCSVALILKASSKGSCLILQMREVMSPQILLQWVQSSRFCRWQRCMTLDSLLSASTFQSQKLVFFNSFCQWNLSLRIVDNYNNTFSITGIMAGCRSFSPSAARRIRWTGRSGPTPSSSAARRSARDWTIWRSQRWALLRGSRACRLSQAGSLSLFRPGTACSLPFPRGQWPGNALLPWQGRRRSCLPGATCRLRLLR